MKYNTSGQRFICVAIDSNGFVTGEAANITATLSLDGGSPAATNDTNPTELGNGRYAFDLLQAETNAHELFFNLACSTSGVMVTGSPSDVIYTTREEEILNAISSSGGASIMNTSQFTSTLQYKYTTDVEMQRLFSRDGIDFRRDDYLESTESELYSDVIEEIIDQASWEVKAILNKKFRDEDAYSNIWIRRRATIIACHLLSIRRGNDAQYFNEFLDAKLDLEDAVIGRVQLGIPSGQYVRAGMINVSSDNRYPYTPMRVDFFTSTDLQGARYWNYYRPYIWI